LRCAATVTYAPIKTEQQDGTFQCLASILSNGAISQRYDLIRRNAAGRPTASALLRGRCFGRLGPAAASATHRIALNEIGTAHTGKTQSEFDGQAGFDEGRSLNPKRFPSRSRRSGAVESDVTRRNPHAYLCAPNKPLNIDQTGCASNRNGTA
jgi:hypothetical protein